MSKKFDLKITILTIFNLAICLCLIILKAPNSIPLFFSTNETICVLGSKWWLLISAIIPTALGIIINLTQNKTRLNFVLKMLFAVCLYENMLIMIYISATESFELSQTSEIPLSLIYFLPLSACIMIGGLKLKTIPYNSFSFFKTKYSTTSEFIWKQTHIFAKDITFAIGFILVIITMIFAIFRLFWFNLAIIIAGILTVYFLTLRESILMSKKFNKLQEAKDKLTKIVEEQKEEDKNTTK